MQMDCERRDLEGHSSTALSSITLKSHAQGVSVKLAAVMGNLRCLNMFRAVKAERSGFSRLFPHTQEKQHRSCRV